MDEVREVVKCFDIGLVCDGKKEDEIFQKS